MSEIDKTDPTAEANDDIYDDGTDAELEAMKQRVKEMEAEAAKLRELQADAEREDSASASGAGRAGSSTPADPSAAAGASASGAEPMEEDKEDVDSRSVYVGNVDYSSTPEEIQVHFAACGQINRVTILCDKFTGHPKGFAYVEFAEPSFATNALVLDESLFRGRPLKVTAKRTNIPNFNGRGRGRGARGGGRGAPRGAYGFAQGPRGRGYRGRGRGY